MLPEWPIKVYKESLQHCRQSECELKVSIIYLHVSYRII